MEKRTSAFSRIFAAIALVGAVVVVVVVISSSLGEDSGSSTKGHGTGHAAKKHSRPKTKAATYTVETGDTLTSIAHEDRRPGGQDPRPEPRSRPADPDRRREAEAAMRRAPPRCRPAGGAAGAALSTAAAAAAQKPRVEARAWALIDARTGEVLTSHAAARHLPIASTTKLMTAWVVAARAAARQDRPRGALPQPRIRRVADGPAGGAADQRPRPPLRPDPAQRQRRRPRPRRRGRRFPGALRAAR